MSAPAPPSGAASATTTRPPDNEADNEADKVGKSRLSLRFKFLAVNLCVALIPTIIVFSAWEYFSYVTAVHQLEQRIDEVSAIQSEILGAPVWNLETDRMELVLDAILQDSDFVMALVHDERGRLLAQSGAVAADQAPHIITTTNSIHFDTGAMRVFIGELNLIASDERIRTQIWSRLYVDFCMILLWLCAAICATWYAFRRTIETPLSRLLDAIHRTRQNVERTPVDWTSDDEMGVVINQFNAMQERQEQYEAELEAGRSNLEVRVKERTAELVRARDEADAASRAKSEFLAVMSHELRTPLNGVLGLAQSLLDTTLDGEQQNRIALMKESGWALMSLLDDMLDLTKVETGSLELEILTFDLEHTVKRISDLWSGMIEEKGLVYALELPDEPLPLIKSDPTRLRQVIQNLLSNAIKFTKAGEIRLNVSCQESGDDRVEVRFEVHDTGEGIDPQVQDGIFEKFTQADNSITRRFGGSGLGLSICRELAALMGGDIGVDSTPGQGSCFWFTIVCDKGSAEAATEVASSEENTESPDPNPSGRALRLLVAEDNHVNRVVIRCILESMGHTPVLVENGEEAVAAVASDTYDIVLMDVQMPVMDGISATRTIRSSTGRSRDIPIIAITANAMRGDRERFLADGFSDYVSKPIDAVELHKTLERCAPAEVCNAGDAHTDNPRLATTA
jgi:signal transduction histidine kinase/ActR/RegA family two-component response regulator